MNKLDANSKPLKQESTGLATLYWLNPRDSKKGRLFIPVYDERYPLAFKTRYSYISKFHEKNNCSGNHYHKAKKEILIPLYGKFEICLENVITKEKEKIRISASENKAVYIRTGIAHMVRSLQSQGILLVLASTHSSMKDEIEYIVKEK